MSAMTQIETYRKVLEAAVRLEAEIAADLAARNQVGLAAEHEARKRALKYALDLMNDQTYLQKQAEILDVLPAQQPAWTKYDMSDEQAAEIRNDGRAANR